MNDTARLVCFGDLMLECILPVASLPTVNVPFVVDGRPFELGGTAYNLCWYLAQWNWPVGLVGFYGRRQEALLGDTLAQGGIDPDCVLAVDGDSDFLTVFHSAASFFATYLRSHVPEDCTAELITRCGRPRCLILAGSRHRALRRAANIIAQEFQGEWLAFSPSYAIYDYEPENLMTVLRAARATALNEHEAAHACSLLGLSSTGALAALSPGYLAITRGDQGVTVFHPGGELSIGSFSGVEGDVIGAGDAFFAGFLHVLLGGGTVREAALVASLVARNQVHAASVRAIISVEAIRDVAGLS